MAVERLPSNGKYMAAVSLSRGHSFGCMKTLDPTRRLGAVASVSKSQRAQTWRLRSRNYVALPVPAVFVAISGSRKTQQHQ